MDRRLVERARDGDHAAFCALVERHVGRMTGTARLILRDADAAEDAVQDALLETWRSLPTLRDPDRFDAWSRRLLIRSCMAHGRHRRDRAAREITLAFESDRGPSVSDSQRSVADRDQLEGALRLLTVDQRAVLVLAYYLDLPIAEAAQALGIPVGTMKSRLHRALDALRAALEAGTRTERFREVVAL